MDYCSKKAQFGTVVVIIILIASAIVLFIFGSMIVNKGKESAEVETCRISVLTQAHSEVFGTSPLSLECARRYVHIFDTHVDIGTAPDKQTPVKILNNGQYVKSFKTINADIVNYVVAEEMRKCWYQFNEAQTEIFPNNEPLTTLGDTSICFVCDDIYLDMKNPGTYSGLIDFLKQTYIKDSAQSYWDYLNSPSISMIPFDYIMEKSENREKIWGGEPLVFGNNNIKAYSIIFFKQYMPQKDYPDQKIMTLLGDWIFNKKTDIRDVYMVYPLPSENLDTLCETQAS